MMLLLLLKMSSLAGNSGVTSDYQCVKDDSKSAYALLLVLQLLCLLCSGQTFGVSCLGLLPLWLW